MREDDLPAVMGIERRSYRYPWTAWFMRQLLREGGVSSWVAARGGTVAGYGIMRIAKGWAHILNLCVAPESRRAGLGRQLLRQLLKEARRQGATYAWLEVRPTNRGAIALYDSVGFYRYKLLRGYYPARQGRQNALVMMRPLLARSTGKGGATGARRAQR